MCSGSAPKGARAPGGANAGRLVGGINITVGNGGGVGDLDRNELMWRDANNTNIMGQLGSTTILVYPIPPYTPATLLPVSFSGAPAGGARLELWMPRRWSRPWGLEITDDDALSVPRPFESVFDRCRRLQLPHPADSHPHRCCPAGRWWWRCWWRPGELRRPRRPGPRKPLNGAWTFRGKRKSSPVLFRGGRTAAASSPVAVAAGKVGRRPRQRLV
jgi:hypothetical protein